MPRQSQSLWLVKTQISQYKQFPLRGTLKLIHIKKLFTLMSQSLTTSTDQKAKTKGISQACSFRFKNKNIQGQIVRYYIIRDIKSFQML